MSKEYLINNYVELSELGRGAFGIAYKCQNEITGKIVCIKTIEKKVPIDELPNSQYSNKNESFKMLNEVFNMERLGKIENKFFPEFYEYIYTKDFIYIIMEYIDGFYTLSNLITAFRDIVNDTIIQTVFKVVVNNLCLAIKYMHSLNIDHSDLKPDNIMINPKNCEVRIIDYGLSCYSTDCKLDFGYTPIYVDPLLIKMLCLNENNDLFEDKKSFNDLLYKKKHEINFQIKKQADLWSLGCIIYEMLIGEPPSIIFSETNLNNGKQTNYFHDFDIEYVKNYDYLYDSNRINLDSFIESKGFNINLNNLLTRGERKLN
jgi:serine/threonine protein kinase